MYLARIKHTGAQFSLYQIVMVTSSD